MRSKWFFILLAAGVAVLLWKITAPFLLTIITAGVATIVVSPLERRLYNHFGHHRLSSFLITLFVFFAVFVPLVLAGIIMVDQLLDLARKTIAGDLWPSSEQLASHPFVQLLPDFLRDPLLALDVTHTLQLVTTWILQNIGRLAGGALSFTASFLLNTMLFFLTLYYFLVDRQKIVKEILVLSPLKDKDDRTFIDRIVKTVRAVLFGSLIVSTVQGTLAAIGMAIFGVPGFLIWGAVTVVASQVPILGAGLVTVPAILYVAITGEPWQIIGMFLWSCVMVGLVDNLLQPFLIEGKTNMHALMVLISILGSLQLFGPIGLVVGPTILAVALAIIEMYKGGVLEKSR